MKIETWTTSSNKYPERAKSKELTPEVLANAQDLLNRVNALLKELGKEASVSSGFRPSEVNAATPGAAKKSAHMTGKAIDLMDDKDQSLGKLIRQKHKENGLLKRHGLMMENLANTKGKSTNWVHLDTVKRTERESFEFTP